MMRAMHDKLRLSLGLPPCTADDFLLQVSLMSLFVLVEYVHQHRLDPAILNALLAVVQRWRRGDLRTDEEVAEGLNSLKGQHNGEASEVSACILAIVSEIAEMNA